MSQQRGRGGGGRGGGGGGDRGGRGGGGGDRGYGGRGGGPGGGRGGGPGGGRGGAPIIFQGDKPVNVPAHLSVAASDKHIQALAKLPKNPERPVRPGYGTLGTPITLRGNFFAVKVPKGTLYDYRVEISPAAKPLGLRARIYQLLEQAPQIVQFKDQFAHDKGDRIVSALRLPQPLVVDVPFYEEGERGPRAGGKVYQLTIKFDRELDMSAINSYTDGNPNFKDYDPLPIISALNLVLQKHASTNGVRIGQNKYYFGPAIGSLSPGIEVWKGFFISVRPSYKQLLVNVGACFSPFVSDGSVESALDAFSRSSHGAFPTLPPNIIRSIKVETRHLGYKRKYPVRRILSSNARQTKFDCEEFNTKGMTVFDYFKRKYNITLKRPELPVLDAGTANRSNYLPAELCKIIPGNAYRGKLTDKETAQMIKVAKNDPHVTAQNIVTDGFNSLALSPGTVTLKSFGLEVSSQMAEFPGRELPPPGLAYKSGQARLQNGAWNILDVTFQKAATVNSWWVMIVGDGIGGPQDGDRIKNISELFAAKLKKNGVNIPPFNTRPPKRIIIPALPSVHQDPGRKRALQTIEQQMRNASAEAGRPTFILVILFKRDNYIYPGIKHLGDCVLGFPTICMQIDKAGVGDNRTDQYLSNVALKLNTKLGGINHILQPAAMSWLSKEPTMIVGIDVTHPGPGSREGTPSIAAVVASYDKDFAQYPCSLRIQQSKKEMLDELTDMMVERIQLFQNKNKGVAPKRIFVFRDGVSEGQFDKVVREELPQIKNAVRKMNIPNYNPRISIIICGKRHHARFFPTSSNYADRNGNTRAGTVVDKGVTAVFDFDFYLQAHAGLQGTVRPTHYTVVYDECSLSADEIQKGTHDSSYLYARATKAVSLMPPAYYADLACERGRCYLNEFLVLDDGASSVGGGRGRSKQAMEEEMARVYNAAMQAWGNGIHPDMRESMFYI